MSQRHAFPTVLKNFFHPKFKQIFDIYTRSGFTADRRSILRSRPLRTIGLEVEKAEIENVFPPVCLGQTLVET